MVKIQGGGKWYVKFDVLVSANDPNTYLAETHLPVLYDNTVFGTLSFDKINITIDNHFNVAGTDYYAYFALFNGSISLGFITGTPTATKVKINTTPLELLHFKIELPGNVPVSGSCVSFSVSQLDNVSKYTLSSNASTSYYYDKTYYTGAPSITNITPLSIIAGVGDVLTITGNNFGAQRGTVYFKAADDGGGTYLKGLDDQYINSSDWTNTQIKVKVPSFVYKGYESDSLNYSGGAGSGTVKIKTASGDSCESAQSLYIPYSVMSRRILPNINIRRVHITRYECNPDFEFILNSEFNTPSHAIEVRLIDTALSHWSALTGLVLRLEKDNSGNYVYTDSFNLAGKNIIQFHAGNDAYVDNQIGAQTYYGDTLFFRNTGSNMYFPRQMPFGYSWNYNTSGYLSAYEYSFYQVTMHELGHILHLGHVNDDSELMYYRQLNGRYIINLTSASTAVVAVKQNILASELLRKKWNSNSSGRYPPGALQATFITTKACYGSNTGSITTKVSGGIYPYTYKWTGSGIPVQTTANLSNLPPGTYNLELKDNQTCTQNYAVTVPLAQGFNPLTLSFSTTGSNPQLYRAILSGGIPPYSYQWSALVKAVEYDSRLRGVPDGKALICPLPSEYANTMYMPTSYENITCKLKLVVTDANGCQITGYPAGGGKGAMGIENFEDMDNEIVVYPNPTTGTFTISNVNNATIYLYNTISAHIKTFEHVSHNEMLSIGNLPNGIYFLKIIESNKTKYEKLILNK